MTKQINGLAANELSGRSISLSSDGTTVAIGARNANSNAGATRIYKWNSSSWIMLGSQINGLAANEESGFSVSLSSDGTTVAIGARNANSNAGATRIYKWNSSSWIMLGSQINGLAANEQSGRSLSLSSDGTTIAIGAPYAISNAGATRIYKWNSSSWIMIGSQINGLAANELSGYSVSLSSDGTTVAIGVLYANYNNTGATRIYKWNNSSWILDTQINGLAANELSGFSVSLSSNGTTVAIGVLYANYNNTGATRIYKWNNSSWILDTQINGLAANELSGFSVSLSSNGTTVAIGVRNANSNAGATRIYKWNNSSWILDTQINGLAANEESGFSVSLSSDGTTVAIGAPNANDNMGAARIYQYQV